MSKGFLISEETPDREYFTIIPNYILNHSTIWEQGVYSIMKRIAGEEGTCFASHQTIAERIKISRPTVSKTIKKLLKRGWIKEVGIKPAKTHPVKEYQIIDLWKENVEFYRKIRQPQNLSLKDTSTTEPLICKPQNIEEDIYRRRNTPSIVSPKYSSLKDIQETDLVEISEKYKVPLGFVKLTLEKMTNWIEAKGKTYKNYKRALMNWVLSEAQRSVERRQQNGNKRGADLRHLG